MCQRFSSDQRWISFMAVDDARRDVSTIDVMPATGGKWVAVTDGTSYDDKPRWSPDGKVLYFLSARDGALNLWAAVSIRNSGRRSARRSGSRHFTEPVQPSLAISARPRRDCDLVEPSLPADHRISGHHLDTRGSGRIKAGSEKLPRMALPKALSTPGPVSWRAGFACGPRNPHEQIEIVQHVQC